MKILFVTYGGGHAAIVKSLYPTLNKLEKVKINILALTSSTLLLKKAGIPYNTIVNYLHLFPYRDEIMKYGEILAETGFNVNSGLEYNDIETYLGISFYDLLQSVDNLEKALTMYRINGRNVFCPIRTMKRILEYESPDVLIVTCGQRMEKAAALAANDLGIRVVRIEDVPGDTKNVSYECSLCVMNEHFKQIAIKNNPKLSQENIIATGHPVLESNTELDWGVLRYLSEKLRANQFTNVIAFMTQNGENQKEIYHKLYELAQEMKTTLFIIKLHPNQENYFDTNCRPLNNLIIDKECEVKYYINLSDLVITTFSTTGLEAAMMDKPLIVINLKNKIYNPDYCKEGIAVKVSLLDELDSTICKLLDKNSITYSFLKEGRKKISNLSDARENITWQIIRK